MATLVRINQIWWERDGDFAWRVAQIHRKDRPHDGTVELVCERGPFPYPDALRQFPTFTELGRDYELEDA